MSRAQTTFSPVDVGAVPDPLVEVNFMIRIVANDAEMASWAPLQPAKHPCALEIGGMWGTPTRYFQRPRPLGRQGQAQGLAATRKSNSSRHTNGTARVMKRPVLLLRHCQPRILRIACSSRA